VDRGDTYSELANLHGTKVSQTPFELRRQRVPDFHAQDQFATMEHKQSVLKRGIARYREVRKPFATPASAKSRRGLDWMNFFMPLQLPPSVTRIVRPTRGRALDRSIRSKIGNFRRSGGISASCRGLAARKGNCNKAVFFHQLVGRINATTTL
jgi:hypothetical protein